MNSVGYLLSLCRHRYIFDTLVSEIQHKNTQVLIIGAGYDTNYLLLRDKLKSTSFFELDFPATQQRKRKILQLYFKELPNLNFCEIDLKQKSVNQALANSSFDKKIPVFIIIEGVLSYLTKEEIEGLLRELSTLSIQVKIIADYRKPGLDKQKNTTAKEWTRSFSKYHEKYVSFYTQDEMSNLLKKTNLKVIENKDLLDLWITIDQLKPNKKLTDFGGIFIADNGKQ
jgi:methyltransferase (TIGR00027 family)